VQNGPNAWSEAGFNLTFARVTSIGASRYQATWVHKSPLANNGYIAETIVFPTNRCNRDTGSPILAVETIFNSNNAFSPDCLAEGTRSCANRNAFDLHEVAAHEFGHWFFMDDESNILDMVMYYSDYPGDVSKRYPRPHDRESAWIMYGCRSGFNCH